MTTSGLSIEHANIGAAALFGFQLKSVYWTDWQPAPRWGQVPARDYGLVRSTIAAMPHRSIKLFREDRAAGQQRLLDCDHLGVKRFLRLDSATCST